MCEWRTVQRWERGVDLYQLIIHVVSYKNFFTKQKLEDENQLSHLFQGTTKSYFTMNEGTEIVYQCKINSLIFQVSVFE